MNDSPINQTLDNKVEQQLQQQIAQLPNEIKPNRDLWAGIDHAIENDVHRKNQSSWQRLSVVAAGFAIFGWLSWLTFTVGNSAFEPQINQGMGSVGAASGIVAQQNDEVLDFVDSMEQSFTAQKQALLVRYDGQESMVDDWQQQLDELDKAADAIKNALASDPSNAQLIKMLQQTYQQQLDLIKLVNRSPWQQI